MSSAILLPTGERLGLVGRVAITRQDNDLTKPDSTQNSFSTSFTLPDAAAVHKALEHSAEGTSASRYPYRAIAATLETDGVELLPRALLQLQNYERGAGYTVQVFGGNKSFYAALGDKKLRELNLERFEHDWSPANIFEGLGRAANAWREGYSYDLIDRGKGDPASWVEATDEEAGYYELDPYKGEVYPSVFARAVFEQIFTDAGFTYRGALPESFDRLVIPSPLPFGYSQETRDAYKIAAGWAHPLNERLYKTRPFSMVVPYNYVGSKEYAKGKLAAFDPVNHSATILVPGFYNLGAKFRLALECASALPGKVKAYLDLRVNGKQIAFDEMRTGSSESAVLEARYEHYKLEAGDVVDALLRGDYADGINPSNPKWYSGAYYPGNDTNQHVELEDVLEVELLEEFPPEGRVRLADWLPDMTQKEFVKAVVLLYSLQQRPDPYLDIITFTPVADLLGRLPRAEAWDNRLDNGRPPKVSYQLPGFARVNWLRWKEDAANGDTNKGLGDGSIPCEDESLEASKDLFTLPFAASPAGSNGCPLVPRWKRKPESDPADYTEQQPQARVLLRSTGRFRVVRSASGLGHNGEATVPAAYFAASAEAFDLDFARTLIPAFYPVLAAALVAPRVLKPYARLTPDDVVNFDQVEPVWLEREGAFFYVNKLDQYEEGNTTTAVELIRLTF